MYDTDFEQLYAAFKGKKVLVLGDVMLDVYMKGVSTRLCPDATAPVLEVENCEYAPGGGANTAINLAALGANVTCVGIAGEDEDAARLREILFTKEVNAFFFTPENRRTICKTRLMAGGQLIARFDTGTEELISPATARQIIQQLEMLYPQFDAIVVADYRKGLFTSGVIAALQRLQRQHQRLLVVDAKNLSLYKKLHPTLVKPNSKEIAALLNVSLKPGDRLRKLREMGSEIHAVTNASITAVTLDEDGALIFLGDQLVSYTPAEKVHHPHVSGAGDTYISAFTLALLGNATAETAAAFACRAAAIAVSRPGTATCAIDDILASTVAHGKLITGMDTLEKLAALYHSSGQRIVFTNGCFDILHSGHVNYLRRAAALGDVLIVGINTDDSIRRIKGSERPVNSLAERMQVLAGLSVVQHVIPFGSEEDDTPVNLIRAVRPHLFVKGGDYNMKDLPEAPVVEALGGSVMLLPLTAGRSTSAIIRKINETKLSNHA
ncbi:D-glycero-beta-D-manno-heptose 1-phosphate adenylyltransferase [Chitinophaga sp. CB10]|uniref:D-glycero-beta-D-manno-heptose 1-phosphate adenylyltransferase n=1 Tax=Chitinophaga sp. CB10 TaxID=1891659 RepID=UPI000A7C72E7|nr:D-glycero-beta-D-manno-heptose 1-phosphate adenylyltransferase [Chitinophaga sp. CB10]